ncbi:MAG TPA: DUF1287 domain-containing protein [Pyrinomonadaceae bacterium]|nr:DUF1287 domain-containing protein [Pyrinomonadaceae bacterium]
MSLPKIFISAALSCFALVAPFTLGACGGEGGIQRATSSGARLPPAPRARAANAQETLKPVYESPVLERLVAAANERATQEVEYDGSYFKLDYPNGDVPPEKGVCTDEVIRSYRALGIDLQKEVHEDMAANFARYPTKFGLKTTDTNIDHRRVPNLRVFFERKGKSLPITDEADDYRPGDIVTWDLNASQTHIGIVVDAPSATPGRYMILHNIGRGPEIEDVLFAWKITGHYRYTGPSQQTPAPKPTPTTPPSRSPSRRAAR